MTAVGRQLLAVLGVLAATFLLLAPSSCVQACALGGDGCGPTTCETVLGLPAPLGEAWLLVPMSVIAALLLTLRVSGHALLLLGGLVAAGLGAGAVVEPDLLPLALGLGVVVLLAAALLPSRDRGRRGAALTAVALLPAGPAVGLLLRAI